MRLFKFIFFLISALGLQGWQLLGPNPDDPLEPVNRGIFKFNRGLDRIIVKPVAKAYAFVMPNRSRQVINNFYTNINMLPTVANDLLQGDLSHASQDGHRFVLNTILGVGGLLDPATKNGYPLRSNDLGITFAKWGDKHSPYLVIPFLGPSTVRDCTSLLFDYTIFTPYPYIPPVPLWALLAERYVDLRAQMLDSDRLIEESLDKYTFVRDAYLQHRQYLIQGEAKEDNGELYIEENDKPVPTSQFPLTTS